LPQTLTGNELRKENRMARKSKPKKEPEQTKAPVTPPPAKPESVDTGFRSRGVKRWENPSA
jgi:hypothetical protein